MLRRPKPVARVRLFEVMSLRRVYLPEPLGAVGAHELQQAKRRCLACGVASLCEEALQNADARGFSLFCPNAHYLQHLRTASLIFK
jgi:hypothetical protein